MNNQPQPIQTQVVIANPSWRNAIEHARGDFDLAVDNVIKTIVGRYEDAKLTRSWGERNNAYARNGLRKTLLDDYERWKNGELI